MTRTDSKTHGGFPLIAGGRTLVHCILRLPLLIIIVSFLGATACAPEVGSEGWCEDMKEKAKVDWSTREASDFAKHCLFRN